MADGYGLTNATQVSVTDTATRLLGGRSSRRGLIVHNLAESDTAYIGTEGVTATTGIPLAEGETLTFASPVCPRNEVWAICDGSSTATVVVAEVVE